MASNFLAKSLKRSALTVALGLCFAGTVQAQSTTGGIIGTVPAGSTVTISNNSGFTRTYTADANGRFSASNLPIGNYTVVSGDSRREVVVTIGGSANVSFAGAAGATELAGLTVSGYSVNPIDITQTDTRSVLTAQELERLPLTRSAESIALLAPGAITGAAGYFGSLISFGGSGVSENAYYINGYFSGEPLSNLGGFSLPYGALAAQETYLGGYSAKYGRSDGGVISQVGRRGTNDWHFGGEITYTPKGLRGRQADTYFPNIDLSAANSNPNIPFIPQYDNNGDIVVDGNGDVVYTNQKYQYTYEDPTLPGTLYTRGAASNSWSHTYSLYAGGPIIKDRLFFFVAGAFSRSESVSAPSAVGAPRSTHLQTNDPQLYAKIDWAITDNHLLELTYMSEKYQRDGEYYNYNFANGTEGAVIGNIVPTPVSQNSEYFIASYTGYLTDNLTLSATYGHSRFNSRQINPMILPGVPYVVSTNLQNPAANGGVEKKNRQGGYQARDGYDYTDGLRVDLEWVIGSHTVTFGIDNIEFKAANEGTSQVAEYWQYGKLANPNGNISGALGVGAPGGQGYYVRQLRYFNNTSMSLKQTAWYIEDRWQLTDNFMLSLGIRNDDFTNRNEAGAIYMSARNQWAPRIGASWDVFGDSSFKVFANMGRYFLALPNNVAIRGGSASTYTWEYFTYTGVDADGRPQNTTPVPGVGGGPAPGPVSSNLETGAPVDVLAFAPKDLKNIYQDEFILGFEAMVTQRSMLGVKYTHRSMRSSVDDYCDFNRMAAAAGMNVLGIDWGAGKVIGQTADGKMYQVSACYMFNPGGTNTFSFAEVDNNLVPTGTRMERRISSQDLGFMDGMKRTYDGIDVYWARPWDGKWEARIDYTFSRSRGNNEGQVKSEFGQSNISKTQDWDNAEMMQYAYGYLANDRRHQLKARGSYQLAEDWLVFGNLRIMSGGPISCLGFFNPDGSIDEVDPLGTGAPDPVGYGASYHTCFGKVATPGALRMPWTRQFDAGVTYRPSYFDHKLAFSLQVRNLLNATKPLQVDVTSEADTGYTVSNTFMMPIGRQTPRTVMFSMSYDW